MRGVAWLCFAASCGVVSSANRWVGGKRNKVEEKEEDDLSEFERINRLVQQMTDSDGGLDSGAASTLARRPAGGDDVAAGLETMLSSMGDMWEGMMDLPEVQAMLADPAKLREMLVNNPMLDAMPGMREQMEVALASDAFSDPVKLKAAMTEGMAAFKSAGKEFTQEIGKNVQDMMANPEKMNEALKALGLGGAGGGDMAESLQQMFGGADGAPPDLGAMAKMFGMDLTPEQVAEAMAETQKLLGSMGLGGADGNIDPAMLAQLGLDPSAFGGAPAAKKSRRVEL
mmetsp:Transcript_8823/g.29102  ORF Transcript_8823/g.29102 Transcript_8823/m.29102 type:complete len:285 (-) Transcript_8823:159-1013(-)